jgi:choline dehydrogenase-like flavoprotein
MSPGINVTSDADWLEFARQNGQTIYHPMGTCRMGQDDGAVVDLSLKVRGLDGLRVIDASVMPKMVSGNIQAAVMMVLERVRIWFLQMCRPRSQYGCGVLGMPCHDVVSTGLVAWQ